MLGERTLPWQRWVWGAVRAFCSGLVSPQGGSVMKKNCSNYNWQLSSRRALSHCLWCARPANIKLSLFYVLWIAHIASAPRTGPMRLVGARPPNAVQWELWINRKCGELAEKCLPISQWDWPEPSWTARGAHIKVWHWNWAKCSIDQMKSCAI